MAVHLVNPIHVSFGIGVITPRCLFVLAAATPASLGQITDETLGPFDLRTVQGGDVAGIGIHTGNALRGYDIGTLARARGATVVFGGVHATPDTDEALTPGRAHAVVEGDGDVAWPPVLEDAARGTLQPVCEAGRFAAERFVSARWDLLPQGRYMSVGSTDCQAVPSTVHGRFAACASAITFSCSLSGHRQGPPEG